LARNQVRIPPIRIILNIFVSRHLRLCPHGRSSETHNEDHHMSLTIVDVAMPRP
jgi:hypothetical protein